MSAILQKALDLVPFRFRDKIRKIPVLKQVQNFLVKRMMNDKEFVATISGGPAKGLKFPVRMPGDKQMWIGTWEIEFSEALAANIQKGMVCYDIGGYKGYYAGVMALKGASKVLVFEPMPTNIRNIQKLINENKNLPIELIQAAVSDKSGTAIFKLMPEETMGKLEASGFQAGEKGLQDLEVTCVALDDLQQKGYAAPDFIKIDVEGAEEFVLKGALNLLRTKKPLLMIEVHSPAIGKKCLELLEPIYSSIEVFETGKHPREGTPEICHFTVRA
ncbi:FkbM family methyltransferase [Pollutibacter soli]|uniref:FkbM family methyltransferase n=1 Tax=Pollutibacter soli TaxID=3034157 RepID=UPI003013AB7F